MLPLFPLFTVNGLEVAQLLLLPTVNYKDWQKHEKANETVALETEEKTAATLPYSGQSDQCNK